jgi:hypothetical protein
MFASVESTWISTQLTKLYTPKPTKGITANANLYGEVRKKLQSSYFQKKRELRLVMDEAQVWKEETVTCVRLSSKKCRRNLIAI